MEFFVSRIEFSFNFGRKVSIPDFMPSSLLASKTFLSKGFSFIKLKVVSKGLLGDFGEFYWEKELKILKDPNLLVLNRTIFFDFFLRLTFGSSLIGCIETKVSYLPNLRQLLVS